MVNIGQDQEKSATGCFLLNKQQQIRDEGELSFLVRDGLSSNNSSFHSSEGEGTDHEGDILDCSGSRPLLLDSEEEEEACKINSQHQESERVSPRILDLQTSQNVQGKVLLNAFPEHLGEASGERDVFATAPFRSFKTHEDDLDVFIKAPFLSKSHMFPQQLDEGDVFLKAPFTKRRSQEELTSCSIAKEPPSTVGFIGGSAGTAQYVLSQDVAVGLGVSGKQHLFRMYRKKKIERSDRAKYCNIGS